MTQLEAYNLLTAAMQSGTYRPHAPFEELSPTNAGSFNPQEETCTNHTPSGTD